MIAISSLRPVKDCPVEIYQNQLNAWCSWLSAFDKIYYLNNREAVYGASRKVCFVPRGTFDKRPSIKEMCKFASQLPKWSCIINSDIIVHKDIKFSDILLKHQNIKCFISRRWNIPKNGSTKDAKVTDLGLDFFAASPEIWSMAHETIPEDFQIGKIQWDTWMLAFFIEASKGQCADITNSMAIFHPEHEHRRDQHLDSLPDTPYLHRKVWPAFEVTK